jgi:Tfp pilus assembly PilM family ATPase
MFARLRTIPQIFGVPAKHRVGAIGFELSAERLHLLQMERREEGYLRIRAAGAVPYPRERNELLADPAAFKSFIRQALASRPFQGREIVTCLPYDKLKMLSFKYRINAGQSDAEALLKGVRERLGDGWRDPVIDYLPIRKGNYGQGERSALVAVTRRESIIEFLELFRGAGLSVAALEIGPLAIKRVLASMVDDKSHDLVLAINFGRAKSYLTAMSGKRLLLDREIDFGERQIIKTLDQELDLNADVALSMLQKFGFNGRPLRVVNRSAEDDPSEIAATLTAALRPMFRGLAEEIRKVSLYLASETHGSTPKCIYLLGGIARWPGADELLSYLLRMPVKVLNPFSAFLARADGAVLADLDPIAGMALSTGLALRGMES